MHRQHAFGRYDNVPLLLNRDFLNGVADPNYTRDDDPGIDAAQPKFASHGRIYESAGIGTESLRKLTAAKMRGLSYCNDRRAHLETSARREVMFA